MTISGNAALPGYYDYIEVARSVLIAIVASYVALDLAGRVTVAKGRAHLAWLSGGAIAMGLGIWTMHLKGMMAYHLPVPVEYHWPTVLASLLLAILASALALYVASRRTMSWVEAVSGGAIMSVGISGMHYVGMAAMRLPAITRYSPLLVTLSILLAILFSLIALLMAFDLREETRWTIPRRLGCGVVMGAAVSAMHYTGMAAATFFPGSSPDLSHAVNISPVGNNAIAIVTLIVILAAMVTSSVDRRASTEVERVNRELERRVAERTSQLEEINHALRREIAERERTEQELRRSEAEARARVEELGAVLDAVPGMTLIARDPACRLITGSRNAYQMLRLPYGANLSMSAPVGERPSNVRRTTKDGLDFSPEELPIQRAAATGQEVRDFEMTLTFEDGTSRTILGNASPLLDDKGAVRGAVGCFIDIEDRKRAEARLREYEKAVEGLEEMIVVIDRNYRYVLANRAYLKYRRMEREQLVGKLLSEILNKGAFETMVKPKLDEGFQGKVVKYEIRDRHPHLGERDLLIVYSPVEGQTGIDRLACVLQDITERKQAEEALRASEREQRKIAEQLETERARLIEAQAVANVGSWEIELPSLDVTWSEQTHRIFETDPSYFHPSRSGFVKFVHPEDRAKVDAAFEASLEKGAASMVEYRIVMADGRVKVLEEHWKVFHDRQGRPARLIGTCHDITERKQAEAALRESEARFRLVADSAPVMIWMSGTDKLRTDFNKPWLGFTGRSLEQELGNGWAEGVHPEDLPACMVTYALAFDHREAFRMEYRLRRHDGEFRWVLDSGVPRFNPDGSFAGYIGSAIDVTEQRRAEEQHRQAQDDFARVTRVAALGELAATIAHEVNQPLTAIVTNGNFTLRQLERSTPNLKELQEAVKEIVEDGTRASAVISRIRALLKKGTPERAELDINGLIREVANLVRNEATRNGVSVQLDLATGLPRILGDWVQLRQVLINLIMNSIDAMRALTGRPRQLIIRSGQTSEGVTIEVHDTGEGIAQDEAQRIFEPFFTTKDTGIGLGLSISQSIVESHGGSLRAVPTSRGARFVFSLPIDREAAA